MKFFETGIGYKSIPNWVKQSVAIASWFLIFPGLAVGFGLICIWLILVLDGDSEATQLGLIGFMWVSLTLGTGGALFWHRLRSLQNKPSSPLRLSSTVLGGAFLLYLFFGVMLFQSDGFAGLFLPPTTLVMTAFPGLTAISWFVKQQFKGITWRQGLVLFACSALFSLTIIGLIQIVLLLVIAILEQFPVDKFFTGLDWFANLLSPNNRWIFKNENFYILIIQLTIIIPLISSLVKPLLTLPWLTQLNRQDIFLLGAIAGAGFAWVETMVFVIFWPDQWLLILLIQGFGGAIHPLGGGLLAVGWHDISHHSAQAWSGWAARFGVATSLHMLWNLGFLLVLRNSFSSTSILATQIPINALIIGPLLVGLGLTIFWAGRSMAQQMDQTNPGKSDSGGITDSNRTLAVWAIASVVAIVPVGLVLLRL